MLIPVEIQADVLEVILRFGHEHDITNLAEILYELLKGAEFHGSSVQTASMNSCFASANNGLSMLSGHEYR